MPNRRTNLPGLVTGLILMSGLLVATPMVIQQNRFLLTVGQFESDLEKIRTLSRRAFIGETRPPEPVDATAAAIKENVFPASWLKGNKVQHPFGAPLTLIKTAESGVKIIELNLTSLTPKECAALLWRLTDRYEQKRWLGIEAGTNPVLADLSPAESAAACGNSDSITLSYKY